MIDLNVNWVAIALAMVASMALGAAWYMLLAKQWMAAAGLSEEQIKSSGGNPAAPFVWAAICQFIMAYFIAFLTPALTDGISVYNAVMVAVYMWFAFELTSMVLNHRYQMKPWSLTLIDGGYLLGVAVVQGVVIGLFG